MSVPGVFAANDAIGVARALDVDTPDGRPRRRRGGGLPKFYTVEQVAEALRVSPRTVRRWIEKGLLVAHRLGGAVRIAEVDLEAFLALHRDA